MKMPGRKVTGPQNNLKDLIYRLAVEQPVTAIDFGEVAVVFRTFFTSTAATPEISVWLCKSQSAVILCVSF